MCRNIHSDITVTEHKERVSLKKNVQQGLHHLRHRGRRSRHTPGRKVPGPAFYPLCLSLAAILLILMMSKVMGKKPRGGEDIEGKVLDLGESTADEPRTGILYMFSFQFQFFHS